MNDHITLSELQRQKTEWERRNFPDMDVTQAVLGVAEETGELAHAVLKRRQNIRGTAEEHTDAIKDACADIIIYLTSVARFEGFDLGEVVTETWEKVRARDWSANPFDGQMEFDVEGTITGRMSQMSDTDLKGWHDQLKPVPANHATRAAIRDELNRRGQ